MRSQLTRRKPQTVWDFMNEVNSMFDTAVSPSRFLETESRTLSLHTDIEELEDSFLFSFDLPGVKTEDIKIDLKEGRLTVSGERKRESRRKDGEGFERIEKSYGQFQRSFQLPNQIDEDGVKAAFDNGILEVRIPKSEVAKPKSIEIESKKGGLFSSLLGSKETSEDSH